ncbi:MULTISPECIES: cobalamin biosynthesis protein [Mycobacteroides]|uniref:Cobalamin biosynthesis protein CobD n=1 Tax=Mycobacteroides chelonae TaxID=1774 RepID=A0A1S1LN88_MYCCH|nr:MULTISPECIES: cobalamin biosynthesis protein [Mycobacteroides]KRQ27394.1 cobalamin biosynthesis protein CobD [Mycobacteroides sp. H003]KRQ36902.1 cobalamin biosynthesis protein CobD [Mycobacteroides sp. H092]KRQ40664.1 cobalamin biosynthesis protein CobD [Mycobacteroides sp. H101]KRQ42359.1 cobalamin biosynthesis protein CobD [Mycobacteroides sp. H063]KRQ54594.1 cobalamin biosynthesis protein CobD [Mycobacteroides sp. HXVII]
MSRRGFRAAGIALGYALDLRFGDPQRFHPVAGFGRAAAALESCTYRDTKLAGAAHTTALLTAVTVAGWVAERAARRSATATVVVTAVATWATLGGTSLVGVGARMSDHLYDNDLDDARALLPSLCGRDPSLLDVDGIARATVESLAENTSDAHTGPLVWAALAGVPGVLAYRAANTLDAMIGHKSARYLRFGWAAARLDDVLNLLPARVTALATALAAPFLGGSAVASLRVCLHDGHRHPSPNAGVAEAAFAGALGLRLGGPVRYPYGEEVRPTLGRGAAPRVGDVYEAARLSRAVQHVTAVIAVLAALRHRRP